MLAAKSEFDLASRRYMRNLRDDALAEVPIQDSYGDANATSHLYSTTELRMI